MLLIFAFMQNHKGKFYAYLLIFWSVFIFGSCVFNDEVRTETEDEEIIIHEPIMEYGFCLDSFQVTRDTVKPNWTMSHMFQGYGLSQFEINTAAEKAADSLIGLRYIKEGRPFIMLCKLGDTTKSIQLEIKM